MITRSAGELARKSHVEPAPKSRRRARQVDLDQAEGKRNGSSEINSTVWGICCAFGVRNRARVRLISSDGIHDKLSTPLLRSGPIDCHQKADARFPRAAKAETMAIFAVCPESCTARMLQDVAGPKERWRQHVDDCLSASSVS